MKRELMKWTMPLLLGFVLMAETRSASAIAITGSASPPSSLIIESQPTASNNSSAVLTWTANANDAHRNSGQTWIHGTAATLDKITVLLNPLANAATLNGAGVSIRAYTFPTGGSAPSSGTPGTPFLTESGTLQNDLVDNTAKYITFDVTDTALAANQQYGFVVDFTGGPNAGLSAILVNNFAQASYGAGVQIDFNHIDGANGGNPDYDPIADDLVFFIQEPPIVPEPTSAVLAGMGLVGLVGFARRQQPRV
jgi:hypothetical protein